MSDAWNSSGANAAISIALQGPAVPIRKELTDQIERFYSEHYGAAYRFLVLTGSQPGDADDVLQEAFVRLLRYLGTGHQVDNPRNWLLRVCHNLRIDEMRRERRRPDAMEQDEENSIRAAPDPQIDPESVALNREKVERVRTAMLQLTERQREFLLLRAEGMKLREIAEMYGVAAQSVAESCARAMDKLGRLVND